MKIGMHAAIAAGAVAALFALGPGGRVLASEFTDTCIKGSGIFDDDAGCKCLEGKVTDSGEKASLIAYFKIQADTMSGKMPSSSDATSATMSKGTELLGKYSGACMK